MRLILARRASYWWQLFAKLTLVLLLSHMKYTFKKCAEIQLRKKQPLECVAMTDCTYFKSTIHFVLDIALNKWQSV